MSDKKPIVISVIALLISIVVPGISLYFQFFHIKTALTVAILKSQRDHDTLFVTISFFNPGNRMALICDARVGVPEDASFTRIDPQIATIPMDPIIINPGEIRTARLALKGIPPEIRQSPKVKASAVTLPPEVTRSEYALSRWKGDMKELRLMLGLAPLSIEILAMSFDGDLYKAGHLVPDRLFIIDMIRDAETFEIFTKENRLHR